MTAWRLSERPRAMAGLGVGLAAGAAWLGLAALGHGTAGHGAAGYGAAGLGIAGSVAPGSGFGLRLAELCLALGAPGVGAYPVVAAMWLMMSVAMMLPTAAPAIDLYARLSRRIERGRLACLAGFAGGYVLAWGGFGLIAAAVQMALGDALGQQVAAGPAAGAVLVLAGGYQLTPLKAACLTLCRNPLAFFMAGWRDGPAGALAMGLRHGLICIGCCWALMALMLLAGTMNLVWMAALGALMLAEKTLPHADRVGRLAGAGLVIAGVALILDAIV